MKIGGKMYFRKITSFVTTVGIRTGIVAFIPISLSGAWINVGLDAISFFSILVMLQL